MNTPTTQPDFESSRRKLGPTRIGDWVLHADLGVLRRADKEVRLNAKTLHVLLVLLESGERGVSRSELLDQVWGTAYPSDSVVSRAISDLRSAFGERAGEEKFFRTLPKYGYQLVAKVEPLSNTTTRVTTPKPGNGAVRKALTWLLSGVVIVLAFFLTRHYLTTPSDTIGRDSAMLSLPPHIPLTSATGLEHQPRFVNGSDWIVYAALRSGQQDWDLFRVRLADGSTQPVAVSPGIHEHGPAVSPSGDEVAYVQLGPDGCRVVTQALVLGVPKAVGECTGKFPTLVDWSADGNRLAYTGDESADPDGYRRLYSIDIGSGTRRRLSTGVSPTGTDFYPRFSPDDSRLAFLRGEPQPDHRSTLWMLDTNDRSEKQLTTQAAQLTGMAWLDERRLIFGYIDSGKIEGRVLNVDDGTLQIVEQYELIHPDFNRSEQQLVGARQLGKRDLYLAGPHGTGKSVAESTGDDYHGRLSPDEEWLAFVSNRSGYEEIWIASTHSGVARRLTNFGGATVRYPDWHPDGDRILFSAQADQRERLFEVELISGTIKPLAMVSMEATSPRWMPDGSSVVHGCRRGNDGVGGWSVCLSTKDDTRQYPGSYFLPQPLNNSEVAVVDGSGSIFRLNLAQESFTPIQSGLHPRAGWEIAGNSLFYIGATVKGGGERVVQLNLESGLARDLFVGELPLNDVTISVGAKSGSVLFTRHQQPSDDLVLIRDPGF